jgi:hypothetical protein
LIPTNTPFHVDKPNEDRSKAPKGPAPLNVQIAENNTRPFAPRSATTRLRADACIRRVARKRRGAGEHDNAGLPRPCLTTPPAYRDACDTSEPTPVHEQPKDYRPE